MYFFGLQVLHPIVVVRKYPESVPSARLPIANAKVTHYYNCYNRYFVGCLPSFFYFWQRNKFSFNKTRETPIFVYPSLNRKVCFFISDSLPLSSKQKSHEAYSHLSIKYHLFPDFLFWQSAYPNSRRDQKGTEFPIPRNTCYA